MPACLPACIMHTLVLLLSRQLGTVDMNVYASKRSLFEFLTLEMLQCLTLHVADTGCKPRMHTRIHESESESACLLYSFQLTER
jgi:hypothetical protein